VDIRTLRYFIAAAETENLSRASERLNIVQSALSHQIRGLEAELGAQLFTRIGRRIQLSDVGKVFLEDARAVLQAVETARRRVVQAARGAVGELRIGFETISSRNILVSEALLAFRDGFPDVTVELAPMPAGPLLDAVRSGAVDAGFVYVSETYPELSTLTFQETDWLLVLPRNHRLVAQKTLRLKDLEGEPFVWRPRSVAPVIYDAMLSACMAGGLVPNIVQEAYNEIMMVNLVSVGLGACFLVDTVTQQWPGDVVAFRKVEDFSLPLRLCLAWRRDNDSMTLPHLVAIVEKLSGARPD
jgi:DNA-binding transcriptional LysR family regulator